MRLGTGNSASLLAARHDPLSSASLGQAARVMSASTALSAEPVATAEAIELEQVITRRRFVYKRRRLCAWWPLSERAMRVGCTSSIFLKIGRIGCAAELVHPTGCLDEVVDGLFFDGFAAAREDQLR